jgi:hypothetical protein
VGRRSMFLTAVLVHFWPRRVLMPRLLRSLTMKPMLRPAMNPGYRVLYFEGFGFLDDGLAVGDAVSEGDRAAAEGAFLGELELLPDDALALMLGLVPGPGAQGAGDGAARRRGQVDFSGLHRVGDDAVRLGCVYVGFEFPRGTVEAVGVPSQDALYAARAHLLEEAFVLRPPLS